MRRTRSLQVILTVNAVLLAGVLILLASSRPGPDRAAVAVPGIPNAAEQRQQMIDALRDLRGDIRAVEARQREIADLLRSGEVSVQVR